MNKINKISFATLILFLIISCDKKVEKTTSINVQYSGALRNIMSGNISSTISLDSLSKKKNLYALGAIENLKGEIQIFNSNASNSFVNDSILEINDSFNTKAALFVYAKVNDWETFQLKSITTKNDLEEKIFETAKSYGIDIEKPFPFLIEGQITSLEWHVINWKDGDTIHSHKKHKESGLYGTLNNIDTKIIGFYSTKHKAIFTHHTTNMHMHFKTEDGLIAGHIDDLKLKNEVTLKLPKK